MLNLVLREENREGNRKKAGSGMGLFVILLPTARHSLNHHKRNPVYGCCARPATAVLATLPSGKSALSRGSTAPRTGERNRARKTYELPLALSFRHKAAARHQEISG